MEINMKENITLEELEAFQAGYITSSKHTLELFKEHLLKIHPKAPSELLRAQSASIMADLIDNTIKRTDHIIEGIEEKIAELEPLRDLEKKEDVIRQ